MVRIEVKCNVFRVDSARVSMKLRVRTGVGSHWLPFWIRDARTW